MRSRTSQYPVSILKRFRKEWLNEQWPECGQGTGMAIRETTRKSGNEAQAAQVLALNALAFLASDEDRLANLLLTTGLDLGALRDRAGEPAFLAGILDFLLGNEALLLLFAAETDTQPEMIARARQRLPGYSDAS